MKTLKIRQIIGLLLLLVLHSNILSQTEIWKESFSVPNKGYWGGGNNMSGVSWTIDISKCTLSNNDDYIKTVSTKNGKYIEARDIDGEAVWKSEIIQIDQYENVSVTAKVKSTGNSSNTKKYVKIYYKINSGAEVEFEINGSQSGKFNEEAKQTNLNGNNLQIIVKINNPNSGDRTIFDEITVKGKPKGIDDDSKLYSGSEAEPNKILSTSNDNNLVQVLDFELTDSGSGDGKATIIKEISFTPGTNNEIADWEQVISQAKMFETSATTNIGADKITFTLPSPIEIPDGGNKTFQLKIALKKDLSSITDNDKLEFKLNCDNITTDNTGSSFASGELSSGGIAIAIEADSLRFKTVDKNIFCNTNFTASVEAVDKNGNIDTDFNGEISISENSATGNLSAASGLAKNASNGYAQWTDLQYNTPATFKLKAGSNSLKNAISQDIISENPSSSLHEDFEDGDLKGWLVTNDWKNSKESPISGNNSLKHNLKDVKGISYITHNLKGLKLDNKTVSWSFNIKKVDWNLNTKNGFWFYLLANEKDLKSSTVDGYAVGIELNASTANKCLTLWEVTDGAISNTIIKSDFEWKKGDIIGIRVERSTSGQWTLSYCTNNNFSNLQIAGTAKNTKYTFTNYCGLVFKFKSSTSVAGKLWIDDIDIDIDKYPPKVNSIVAKNSKTIKVKFSEIVDKTSAEDINNYNIKNFGKPTTASLSADNTTVELQFNNAIEDDKEYSLQVFNVKDLSQNIIKDNTFNFVFTTFKVKQIFVISKNELLLAFSQKLDPASVSKLENFNIDNAIGKPLSTEIISDTLLSLKFSNFKQNINYNLSLSNIKSKEESVIQSKTLKFQYYPGKAFDLVINELMCDINPAPQVLPNHKYIELYNRSDIDIDLSSWKIQLGNKKPKEMKPFILPAHKYLIVCSSATKNEFSYYGNTMGILIDSDLKTDGTQISLLNKEGDLIDYVNYNSDWYANAGKNSGGWSLERIDANNFCGRNNNWRASEDYKGGTPGKINSIHKNNADKTSLKLLSINVLSPYKIALSFNKNISNLHALKAENFVLSDGDISPLFINYSDSSMATLILQFESQFKDAKPQKIIIKQLQDFCGNTVKNIESTFTYYLIYPKEAFAESSKFVRIVFSEEVEMISAQSPENYVVNNGLGTPKYAYKQPVKKNEVFLEFANDFKNGTTYKVSIKNVKDLYGNSIKPKELQFIYFQPSKNDVVINEILFNPKPKGVDFVEIYNVASMPVDLMDMFLASKNENGEIENKKQLSYHHKMLVPGKFLCISKDTAKTKQDYPAPKYDYFLQISQMPSFNNDKGTAVLMYGDSIIDEFSYSEKMHFDLISNKKGVSLERINPLKPSNDEDNWHSAASTAGFATPANKNSQYKMLAKTIDKEVEVEPETFSPDNDGYDDQIFIRYKFPESGYVANVSIYDGKGILVKRIAQNELLSAEGEFSWDGLYTDKTKARIGIYLIYFEVFNLEGVVKKTKKVCVLAGKLE